MENLQERKRSFNINSLSAEAAQKLSDDIGAKVRQFCDEAVEKANKILNVYGMKAQMQIVIEPTHSEAEKLTEDKPKKKRGRPRKAANL